MNQNNIFIVGIKGVGMANIAIFLSQMGKNVKGSDVSEEFGTDEQLKKNHIEVVDSFDASALPDDIELVLYSGANGGSANLQVVAAQKKNIKTMTQAEFLGETMKSFKQAIAVCGTHGKTTTSSLIAFLLKELEAKPSYIVGTSTFNDVAGGEYHDNDYLVIEADEYAVDPPTDKTPKFQHLSPTHIVCTSIDFDHPDVFKDIEQTKDEFLKFFKKISSPGQNKLFLCADDSNIAELLKKLPENSYTTFGFSPYSHFMASNVVVVGDSTLFDVTNNGVSVGSFSTKLFGDKMIGNITGAIALLINLGFSAEDIHKVLPEFNGVSRRFEFVASERGVDVYDDYAHHPAEIEATIEAARQRFGDRRILLIFQPHTFSRTQSLKKDFVEALSKANAAFIAPIFASARENSHEFTITSDALVRLAKEQGIHNLYAYKTNEELLKLLKAQIKSGDVLFTMGAGDIYKAKNDIISLLKTR